MYRGFQKYIVSNNLVQKTQRVLVGCSGGADSMCLLELMQMLALDWQLELIVCHVNHNLRGLEAERDADFVRAYCEQRELVFVIINIQVKDFAEFNDLSIEQAARQLRYQALHDAKAQFNCDLIATAHNKNDQAETFLLNMLRGAGIDGLKGMLPKQGDIIRPLLDTERVYIEDFCLEHNIEYCHDSTNDMDEYLRNCVRHELLPMLSGYNSNIVNCLTANMKNLAHDAIYLNSLAKEAAMQVWGMDTEKENADCGVVYLDLKCLNQLEYTIRMRVFLLTIARLVGDAQGIGREHLLQLDRLAQSNSGSKRLKLPRGMLVRKLYDKMSISIDKLINKEDEEVYLLIDQIGVYEFKAGKILVSMERLSVRPKSTKDRLYIPRELVNKVLVIRSRRSGDFFRLEGGCSKSVKKFFIDQKVDQESRNSIPLVYLADRLVCILGYRLIENDFEGGLGEYLVLEYMQK